MSDTPRTDEALKKARPILQKERDAMYLLARQLERELEAATLVLEEVYMNWALHGIAPELDARIATALTKNKP